jgi:hypothetical protein
MAKLIISIALGISGLLGGYFGLQKQFGDTIGTLPQWKQSGQGGSAGNLYLGKIP